MPCTIYIATSIDGFIATPDGGIDWLHEIPNPEQSDFGFAEFMGGIDALLMGRHTFEKVLTFGFWPYEKPVFVASRSLASVPEEAAGKAELVQGEPAELVAQLKARGHAELYVDGGRLAQSFLEADLVDRLVLSRIPILLGEGIPLFGGLSRPLKFELEKSEVHAGALVQSHYRRVVEGGA